MCAHIYTLCNSRNTPIYIIFVYKYTYVYDDDDDIQKKKLEKIKVLMLFFTFWKTFCTKYTQTYLFHADPDIPQLLIRQQYSFFHDFLFMTTFFQIEIIFIAHKILSSSLFLFKIDMNCLCYCDFFTFFFLIGRENL